jgi:hypothetical protein
VAALERDPSAADMATPRTLGKAPTRTEHPRPGAPVAPSREREPTGGGSEGSGIGTVLLLIVLTLIGAWAGVALSLWR